LNTNESNSYSIKSYSTPRLKSFVPVFSSIDGSTSSQIDLTRAVQSYLNQKIPSPFIIVSNKDEMISLDQNVTFSTDLVKGQGVAEYSAMAEIWSEACSTELLEAVSSVNRVAMTSQNIISVQWNVSFIPDSLQSLVWFSRRIPRTKLLFFNVLDKEKVRSVFSWKAFRIFLERILYTGVILLPHAVILGTTELAFRESVPDIDRPNTQKKWILVSSKEKINLVRSIDAGLLKNRKLATDLLQFLDSRKPSTVSLSDWNDVLVDRVPTRTVPGMGQFDIDGLEGTVLYHNYIIFF
jgi:hypothetical protein